MDAIDKKSILNVHGYELKSRFTNIYDVELYWYAGDVISVQREGDMLSNISLL